MNFLFAILILAALGFVLALAFAFRSRRGLLDNNPFGEYSNAPETPGKSGHILIVKCAGGSHASKKYDYSGLRDCSSALSLMSGPIVCPFGCVGLGSCARACPTGAISIINGVAIIDQKLCDSCMKCQSECPRGLIQKFPENAGIIVPCSSSLKGDMQASVCEIGCSACKTCEFTCKHKAIRVTGDMAAINYSECVQCGDCAEKCPRHLIIDSKMSVQYQRSRFFD